MRHALSALILLCTAATLVAQRDRNQRIPREDEISLLDVAEAARIGCERLLQLQEDQDKWPYEGVYSVRGQTPIGYAVGGTAICCLALVETPGYEEDQRRQQAVARSVAFILKALQDPLMDASFDQGYDVRGWGHTYALLFFLTIDDHGIVPADLEDEVASSTIWLIKTLEDSAIPRNGGWNYSRRGGAMSSGAPFMTAPTLQALFHAGAKGHDISATVVEEALDGLERTRTASGGYAYSSPAESYNDKTENELTMMHLRPGSVGRMVAVESTLMLAGRGDPSRLYAAIDAFFTHWDELEVRRQQPRTHIPPYGVAPYFFIYAHYYAAQAIEMLPDELGRDEYRVRLNRILASVQEESGGWNDRVFERSENYGTAMAIMALQMKDLPAIPHWSKNR